MTNDMTKKGRGVLVATPGEEGRTDFGAQARGGCEPTRCTSRLSASRSYERRPAARTEEKRRRAAALHKMPDGAEIWKQFEDLLIPRLRLTVIERAVYSHLLRHSRLEGKQRLRFSILGVAKGAGLSTWAVRKGVRRLAAKGALRLAERSKKGHVVEVHLPEEIRAVRARRVAGGQTVRQPSAANLEEADFLETRALREAIHAREGGRCFYCLRRLTAAVRCIDHVIPQVGMGSNSYRNLVSCCAECNSQKGEREAKDFLRWLYREGRLTGSELSARLRMLEQLAAGKLRPALVRG